jgi:long-chain acyl-CoA synthetase
VASIGEARKYITALIALDPEVLQAFADERGLSGDFAALTQSPEVQAAVGEIVAAANQHLARVEQYKRFYIVPEPWVPGSDLVTSSMKVRRRAVNQRYAAEIEALYDDASVPAAR